jgi:hypothetical protein
VLRKREHWCSLNNCYLQVVKNILQEDFGIELVPNPSNTFYEEETIAELQQEELVWKARHEITRI